MSISERYHEGNSLQVVVTSQLLESVKTQLKKKFSSKVKMIDIGTGDGRVLTEVFIKNSEIKFSQIIGSDKREEVINLAEKLYSNYKLNFKVLDIENGNERNFKMILHKGQFELATSFFALHYARDYEKVFRNINKLLKVGGSFYFNFINTSVVNEILNELAEKYPEQKEAIYSDFPAGEVAKDFRKIFPEILKICGFSIDFLKYERHDYDYKSEEAMKEKLSVSISFCHDMVEDVLRNFMNDFAAVNDRISMQSGKGAFVLPHIYVHGLITKVMED